MAAVWPRGHDHEILNPLLTMPVQHEVQPGECLASIAFEYGFFPDTVWNDPGNAELKRLRKDPNVLRAGDTVVVMDKRLKEETGATAKRHRFRRKGVPELFRVVLQDDQGKPRKGLSCDLWIDGVHRPCQTDAKGTIEEKIPPAARAARLRIGTGPEAEEYLLGLGELDPITELEGVQMRLRNLGLFFGQPNGSMTPGTHDAIEEFQRSQGLEPTGDLDETTRQKLEQVHGS